MIRCSFGSRVVYVGHEDLYTPLHAEKKATQIAKQAALLPIEIAEERHHIGFPFFKQCLEFKHRAASLSLSDAADFCCSIVRNARQNLSRPFRSLLGLKNSFSNIPAILVGAGPSLEQTGHCLASFTDQALIFAGGHALKKIQCEPHFGAIVDKHPPDFSFPYQEIPLCFQARAHPDHFICSSGEALLVPDSHFSYLSNDLFDGGWTVGNFMMAIAAYFGCNPIICVGMDYCYQDGKKYAFEKASVDPGVQEDWLMSVAWAKEFARNHPEKTFLNASSGLKYFLPISLEELSFEKKPIKEIIRKEIAKLPSQTATLGSIDELFDPLWEIWGPVIAREGDFSEEDMKLHQTLFFQQVKDEYQNL